MALICHEDYPNLILRTSVVAIENIQEFTSQFGQRRTQSRNKETTQQLWPDGISAYRDFESHGNLQSLDQAISKFGALAKMTPKSNPDLPGILMNLGVFLRSRFEQLGMVADVNNGIKRLEMAVGLVPDGHPDKPGCLSNLGSCLARRFDRLGNLSDLDSAVSQLQASVDLTPEGHLDKPGCLSNLGSCLQIRFERLGNLSDLDSAIIKKQLAVNLTPDGHIAKPSCLNNLGTSLLRRFEYIGNLSDLESAISQFQSSVNLTPEGHPDKPSRLISLGVSLLRRFERLGNLSDVDSAISHQQLAIKLTPDGHPDKPNWLNSLGASLVRLFERLGNLSDLDGAISQLRASVDLTPDGHTDKPGCLSNLGGSLMRRFERLGNISDLDSAISHLQSSIGLTPDGHPDKPGQLNNLGGSLVKRFGRLGNMSDLDSAISHLQSSVNLTPDGHPTKPSRLNNLGSSLVRRFERLGNLSDLDSTITQFQSSVNFTPEGHPDKPNRLRNLGSAFAMRFFRFSNPHDAEEAITHLSTSTQSSVGPPSIRLQAAQTWIDIASLINHHSLSDAYECAVGLMPVVAWLGRPIRDRHESLVQMSEIARNAAAAAISLEQYDKALEWLEQGRSIVWNQILQLRTPVDELREVNPDLVDQLLRVSQILDRGVEEKGDLGPIEDNAQRYRALTMEWESILKEIRSLPNFEDFLKPLRASQLRDTAQNGPVVIINIAKERCDALALVPGMEEVIHIPLPNITYNKATELRDELKDHLYSSGVRTRGERAAQKWIEEGDTNDCRGILAELWNGLVKPVLDSLAFSVRFVFTFAHRVLIILSICSLSQMYYHVYGGVQPDHSPSSRYMPPVSMIRTQMIRRPENMLYHPTHLPYPSFLVPPDLQRTHHSNSYRSFNHRLLECHRSLTPRKSSNASSSILVIESISCCMVMKERSGE
jgi:tetratricopeptide (TPR) repeat protein